MNPTTKAELFKMYQSYKRELWTYTRENYEDELKDWFDEMLDDPALMTRPIRNAHTNALIGFFTVEDLNKENQSESGCRWYISEAYILPAYRNQRFMTSVVHDFIANNKGNIGLVVIKNNIKAMKFWDDVLGGIGYTKERIPHLGNETDIFYRYSEPKIR